MTGLAGFTAPRGFTRGRYRVALSQLCGTYVPRMRFAPFLGYPQTVLTPSLSHRDPLQSPEATQRDASVDFHCRVVPPPYHLLVRHQVELVRQQVARAPPTLGRVSRRTYCIYRVRISYGNHRARARRRVLLPVVGGYCTCLRSSCTERNRSNRYTPGSS